VKTISLLFCLAASYYSQAQDWPRYRGPDLTGSSKAKSEGQIAIDKEVWRFDRGRGNATSPIVAGDRVYVGYGRTFYCLDRADGNIRWSYEFQKIERWPGQTSHPVLQDGLLYFGSKEGNLFALRADKGELAWKSRGAGMITSTPAVAYGMVFYSGWDEKFHALDAKTGNEVWSYQTPGGDASPLVVGKTIYVGSDKGQVYALSVTDGSQLWSSRTGGRINAAPVFYEGLVIFGCDDGNVYAFDAANGATTWTYITNSSVLDFPTMYEGILIVTNSAGDLMAIDAKTGGDIWKKKDLKCDQPVVHNGLVITEASEKSLSNHIVGYQVETGERVLTRRIVGSFFGEAVIAGDHLFTPEAAMRCYKTHYTPSKFQPVPGEVKIGNQIWTTRNLGQKTFRNGDAIAEVTSFKDWKSALSAKRPAWCYYNFDELQGKYHGIMYNVYALTDPRGLAPKGWHIPTSDEWMAMINSVGADSAWTRLVASRGWIQGVSTSNSSRFSALGGGLNGGSVFGGLRTETAYWSAPKNVQAVESTINVHIGINWAPGVGKVYGQMNQGAYVRLVKD
jgi:uncharacterized protein (TIGR02145 family)